MRGADRDGRQWGARAAVLDRLAAMWRIAEASGWTALAIERDAPAERFVLFGIRPGATPRTPVPDWLDKSAPGTTNEA